MQNGIYRHLRFKDPETSDMYFDIITAPGLLLYRGDMGCFEFERLPDMFDFFRRDELTINTGYWAEKIEGVDKNRGIKNYCEQKFIAHIKELAEDYLSDNEEIDRDEFYSDLEGEVLSKAEFEAEARHAADDFQFYGNTVFHDLWESRFDVYTNRFLWCCYAIVWAIKQFDSAFPPAN